MPLYKEPKTQKPRNHWQCIDSIGAVTPAIKWKLFFQFSTPFQKNKIPTRITSLTTGEYTHHISSSSLFRQQSGFNTFPQKNVFVRLRFDVTLRSVFWTESTDWSCVLCLIQIDQLISPIFNSVSNSSASERLESNTRRNLASAAAFNWHV